MGKALVTLRVRIWFRVWLRVWLGVRLAIKLRIGHMVRLRVCVRLQLGDRLRTRLHARFRLWVGLRLWLWVRLKVGPCLTGCLCLMYVQLTMPQCAPLGVPPVCLVACQLYMQSRQTASQTGAHWGTVYYIQRALATSWGWGRLGTECRQPAIA